MPARGKGAAYGGAWRDALRGIAATLAVALGAALVLAAFAAREQGWWQAGYWRLAGACARTRFDGILPIAVPAGLVIGALLLWRRSGRGGTPPLRGALALLALVVAFRAGTALEAWQAPKGPNLLLISIDTLRADRLGAYGYGRPTSPTLDARLAAAGVTFTDVYSQSPKTTPSHMTLFTSLYPNVHGVELWEQGQPGHVLDARVHTLAEVLKNAGYATAAFTGGAHMDPARGFGHGFDVYTEHGQRRRALKWLGRHRHERFFMFYHTYEVHDPYLPPGEYIRMFAPDYRGRMLDAVRQLRAEGDGSEDAWAGLATRFWQSVDKADPREVDFLARLYDAGIRRMDDLTLRALLDRLDQLDLAQDTLVVLTSDHGEAFGEHGRFLHEDLYGETLRVPLILRLPGTLAAGQRVTSRVRLLDVMPTVLDLLGVPAPPAMQGRSLVPLLAGAPDVPAVSEYVTPGQTFESIRRGPLSYVVEGPDARLFDLAKDPGEQTDLAPAQPADAGALRAALDAWRLECRTAAERIGPRDGATVTPSAETTRRLRALGYVE